MDRNPLHKQVLFEKLHFIADPAVETVIVLAQVIVQRPRNARVVIEKYESESNGTYLSP